MEKHCSLYSLSFLQYIEQLGNDSVYAVSIALQRLKRILGCRKTHILKVSRATGLRRGYKHSFFFGQDELPRGTAKGISEEKRFGQKPFREFFLNTLKSCLQKL